MSGCFNSEPKIELRGKLIDKIDELQDSYRGLFHEFNYLDERIKKLEKYKSLIDHLNDGRHEWIGSVNDVIRKIEVVEELLNKKIDAIRDSSKKPHRCPVCKGKGKIQYTLPVGGYWEDNCKPCEGKGIVWG